MKIEYNILWFEDVKSSFDAKKQIVQAIVEGLGFKFPEPRNEVDGTNIENIDYDNFDLIIADLNLAGTKGPALLDKIRNNAGVFTEVVFYSSDGENAVRAALRDFEIDGAYCAGRDNDDFEDKVEKVIRTTVKKVQDLNNMRGLIMAETSDIDHIMFDIIEEVINKNAFGIKDALAKTIYENVESKVTSKQADFEKFKKNGRIDKIIKDTLMFDSYQKILAIQFIIDSIDHELTNPHKQQVFSKSYTELKQKRDLLAHVIEEVVEGKKVLKSGNRELEFTDDFCVEIRVGVRTHGGQLTEILTLVQCQ